MKSFQLKFLSISLLLFASICPLHSQTAQVAATSSESLAVRQTLIAKGLRGYEAGLRFTDSETLVESAIFQSVKMKLREPNQDYSGIIGELQRLAFEAPTYELRYTAYLAACIMPNPEEFLSSVQIAHLKTFTEETRNEFFALVAAALQDQLSD